MRERATRLGRQQRVDEILAAARDVFAAQGYDNTAVAEIAARTGVAEGTVFKYFATKRELLLKVLERWYEDMFGDYARDLAGVAGHRARLRLLIRRHLCSVRDYPLLCRLMFREVRSEQDYHGSDLHALNRQYTRLLLDVIEDGMQADEFRADLPPALLRDLIYGGIEHHTWGYVCGRGELDVDTVTDQIMRILTAGIVSTRAAADLESETRRLSLRVNKLEQHFLKSSPEP
jgi:AcrR family transcriptional regulator